MNAQPRLQLVHHAPFMRMFTAEDRRSITNRLDMGVSIRHLAREYGVMEQAIQEADRDEVRRRIAAAEVNGYRSGRRSLLTPPPATAMRRAA